MTLRHLFYITHAAWLLLASNALLASVETCPMDVSAAYNNHSGYFNSPVFPNQEAFAALDDEGGITTWGNGADGGGWQFDDAEYSVIASTGSAFAAIKEDGSITAWGRSGGTGHPTDSGYVSISSTAGAFAARKDDGGISAWGSEYSGGSGAPLDAGYVSVATTAGAFAAMKSDGSIKTWGNSNNGGTGGPKDKGYVSIYAASGAFAALKADGSISTWGDPDAGGTGGPIDNGFVSVTSTARAFTAMKADGRVFAWGDIANWGIEAPTTPDHYYVASTNDDFAALKTDGTIAVWGKQYRGGVTAPGGAGWVSITSNYGSFAAMSVEGRIWSWGDHSFSSFGTTDGTGYVSITSNRFAFAALKADGSITAWGDAEAGGSGAPTDTGYVSISSTGRAFAALKADGSITAWGDTYRGGYGAPSNPGFITVNNRGTIIAENCSTAFKLNLPIITGTPGVFAAVSSKYYFRPSVSKPWLPGGLRFSILNKPDWASFDIFTGELTGTPTIDLIGRFDDISISVTDSFDTNTLAAFSIVVLSPSDAIRQMMENRPVTLESLQAIGLKRMSEERETYYQRALLLADWDFPESVAELQQIIDNANAAAQPTHTCRMDYSAAFDDYNGRNNKPFYSHRTAFAGLTADGSIVTWGGVGSTVAWGGIGSNGTSAPTGSGYRIITSNEYAYAALKDDGSISSWGLLDHGAGNAPTDAGYIHIASTRDKFAALKADGSVTIWSSDGEFRTGVSSGKSRYISIASNRDNFAALTADGSIEVLGASEATGEPFDSGYIAIASTAQAFAALKSDGTIFAWGDNGNWASDGPVDSGYVFISSTGRAFAALKSDGSITAWGSSGTGGAGAPDGKDYVSIYAANNAFAALKSDGSIDTWGYPISSGDGAPLGAGYHSIVSNNNAFAALKADGSLVSWGSDKTGGTGAPTDSGYSSIVATGTAFAAMKADGSVSAWGYSEYGGSGAPEDAGYVALASNMFAFTALQTDGSINAWGGYLSGGPSRTGNAELPTETSIVSIANRKESHSDACPQQFRLDLPVMIGGAPARIATTGRLYEFTPTITEDNPTRTLSFSINNIPAWASFSDATGTLSGVPDSTDVGVTTDIIISVTDGLDTRALPAFTLTVFTESDAIAALFDNLPVSVDELRSIELTGLIDTYQIYYNYELLQASSAAPLSKDQLQALANRANEVPISDISCPIDATSDRNVRNGSARSSFYANISSFAALTEQGRIAVWGSDDTGGFGAPEGEGFVSVTSSSEAFAALQADGHIWAWGNSENGGEGAPTDAGYVSIASNAYAFAAMTADGRIFAWGGSQNGGSGAPVDKGYVSIASTERGFAALKDDGTITAWGYYYEAPNDDGYTSIYSNDVMYAALKADGSITSWGAGSAGAPAPGNSGYVSITSSSREFVAIKADGSLVKWGYPNYQSTDVPDGDGYLAVTATDRAFAALKADGSIVAWGPSEYAGAGAPTDFGYLSISANSQAFTAVKADGSIVTWGGDSAYKDNHVDAPVDNGFTFIATTERAFAALNANGGVAAWGDSRYGGTGAPTDEGYVSISANSHAFAALKSDGSILTWGNAAFGGTGAPAGLDYVSINNRTAIHNGLCGSTFGLTLPIIAGSPSEYATPIAAYHFTPTVFTAEVGETLYFAIDNVPSWATFDSAVGTLSGMPASADIGTSTNISISVSNGVNVTTLPSFTLSVHSFSDALTSLLDNLPVNHSDLSAIGLSRVLEGRDIFYNRALFNAQINPPVTLSQLQEHIDKANIESLSEMTCGRDVSSAFNDHNGYYTASGFPNQLAFAALDRDGRITSWGKAGFGGDGAPIDSGYQSVVSNSYAFAALKADGSIASWGSQNSGGSRAPEDKGYVSIASTQSSFAALRTDGSIASWGIIRSSSSPTGRGYIHIASTSGAFAALSVNGTIDAWGSFTDGGTGEPADAGYVSIVSNRQNFAALKADGSVTVWGADYDRRLPAPNDAGYVSISATSDAFAGLKSDGSITVWGNNPTVGSPAPVDSGYLSIASNLTAFAALKADGSISGWGGSLLRGSGAPGDAGYVSVFSTDYAFAALKADGSISAWGSNSSGGADAPTDSGYVKIASSSNSFAALKADGSIVAWGGATPDGTKAPTDGGYVSIVSNAEAFAAMKVDGSISVWGDPERGGAGAPTGPGFVSINNRRMHQDDACRTAFELPLPIIGGSPAAFVVVGKQYRFKPTIIVADSDEVLEYSVENKPAWASFEPSTGLLSGEPLNINIGSSELIIISVSNGTEIRKLPTFTISVFEVEEAINHLRENMPVSVAALDAVGIQRATSDRVVDYNRAMLNASMSSVSTLRQLQILVDEANSERSNQIFCPLDNTAAYASSNGHNSFSNYPNRLSFAALNGDGVITAWGFGDKGALGAPTDSGYVSIVSSESAFAAMKADGSLAAWGDSDNGGSGAPTDSGYLHIASNQSAFAALKTDGSITAWGRAGYGSIGAPVDAGYLTIASTSSAFAALKSDGTIYAWGNGGYGSGATQAGAGNVSISSTLGAFAALRADGSIHAWGDSYMGASGAPTDDGYLQIASNDRAFAALNADGTISSWGYDEYGGGSHPVDSGYLSIFASNNAFAALKTDGSINSWGFHEPGYIPAPTDNGYISIVPNRYAFAAMKADGSITTWGNPVKGGTGSPIDSQYVFIASTEYAFAALKSSGSIVAWGDEYSGGTGAPAGSGYQAIASSGQAFAALKTDGSITAWGGGGAVGAPTGNGYISINNRRTEHEPNCPSPFIADLSILGEPPRYAVAGKSYRFVPSVLGMVPARTLSFSIDNLPDWATFDPLTGVLSGTPKSSDASVSHNILIGVSDGMRTRYLPTLTLSVFNEQDAIARLFDNLPVSLEDLQASGVSKVISYLKLDYDLALLTASESPPQTLAELQTLIDGVNTNASLTGSCPADTSAAYNHYSGFYNGSVYPNLAAFAALNAQGQITAWGSDYTGGSDTDIESSTGVKVVTGAPAGNGFRTIVSSGRAYAALYETDRIAGWGALNAAGSTAPPDGGYRSIASTQSAFAALRHDGSLSVWGSPDHGGNGAPTDSGYVSVYSGISAFAAIHGDGSIVSWGNAAWGGSGAPTDHGYLSIASTGYAFASVKNDGHISAWGSELFGGAGAPEDAGYQSIAATSGSQGGAFAALNAEGRISAWGDAQYGGNGAPTDAGYVVIAANEGAFAALKADGSIAAWGSIEHGSDSAPSDSGYVSIMTNSRAFAALKADGSIHSWGDSAAGGLGAPSDSGYLSITSASTAFAAIKADGSIKAWGENNSGGTGAPTDAGYLFITSNSTAFAAMKPNGRISTWGSTSAGSANSPTDNGYVSINNRTGSHEIACPAPVRLPSPIVLSGLPSPNAIEGKPYSFIPTLSNAGVFKSLSFSIANKPDWATFDTATGRITGTPRSVDVGTSVKITVRVTNGVDTGELAPFDLSVTGAVEHLLANQPASISNLQTIGLTDVGSSRQAFYDRSLAVITEPSVSLNALQQLINKANHVASVVETSLTISESDINSDSALMIVRKLTDAGVNEVVAHHASAYADAITNSVPTPLIAVELQRLVDRVNATASAIAQLFGNLPADIFELEALGLSELRAERLDYYSAALNALSGPPVTIIALQSWIDQSNAVARVVEEANSGSATNTDTAENLISYMVAAGLNQIEDDKASGYREAVIDTISAPLVANQLQSIVDRVNRIAQFIENLPATVSSLQSLGIDEVLENRLPYYNHALAAVSNVPVTLAPLQALINDANRVAAVIEASHDTGAIDGQTGLLMIISRMEEAGIPDALIDNASAYESSISGAVPTPLDSRQLQNIVQLTNDEASEIAQLVQNLPTSRQALESLGLVGIRSGRLKFYNRALSELSTIPLTETQLQLLIDQANQVAFAVEQVEFGSDDAPEAIIHDLSSVGVDSLDVMHASAYQSAIAAAEPTPDGVAALQAVIDEVNQLEQLYASARALAQERISISDFRAQFDGLSDRPRFDEFLLFQFATLLSQTSSLPNTAEGLAELAYDMLERDTNHPVIWISVSQAGKPVQQVRRGGGEISVTARISNPVDGLPVKFSWQRSSGTILELANTPNTVTDTLMFEAGVLIVGETLAARVSVIRDGLRADEELSFMVVANEVLVEQTVDSDEDGIPDLIEGELESSVDTVSANRLQSIREDDLNHVLESDPGTRLRLGSVARLAEVGQSRIRFSDLIEHLPGASEDLVLNTLPAGTSLALSEVFDFEVVDLQRAGASARVVLPLLQPLADNVRYMKFHPARGWLPFVEGSGNRIRSSPNLAGISGQCLQPGGIGWQDGLRKGHACIELTIVDGGPNDADSVDSNGDASPDLGLNGNVKDPGAVVFIQKADTGNTTGDTESGTGLGSEGGSELDTGVSVETDTDPTIPTDGNGNGNDEGDENPAKSTDGGGGGFSYWLLGALWIIVFFRRHRFKFEIRLEKCWLLHPRQMTLAYDRGRSYQIAHGIPTRSFLAGRQAL